MAQAMRRALAIVTLVTMATTSIATTPPRWSEDDIWQLAQSIVESGLQGLRPEDYDLAELGYADRDAVADAAAKALAHDLNEGRASTEGADWHVGRAELDYDRWLSQALAHHDLRAAFRALSPTGAGYAQLATAWLQCTNQDQCDTLALNLDRWRRLPRDLGPRYLWVNIPAFRVDLVEQGRVVASHRAVVGEPGSPTPLFQATVTGVTANPRGSPPCAIAGENIDRPIKARPEDAHGRGSTAQDSDKESIGRQRPEPGNGFGQIKLEMPNPYHVDLDEAPDGSLFQQPLRALSPGCIRTDQSLSLVAQFVGPSDMDVLEHALATGATRTVAVRPALPIYVVYFTAEARPAGGVAYFDDPYHRDRRPAVADPE